ncbi:Uncharacterised protein [Yersinia intermedia]|nr:Uncharacterised protein [Yersinia intermedia]
MLIQIVGAASMTTKALFLQQKKWSKYYLNL